MVRSIPIAKERNFRLKFRDALLQPLDDYGLVRGSTVPIPLQYGSQRGYHAGQCDHRLLMPAFGCCPLFQAHALSLRPVFPAHMFGFRTILPAVTATTSAVKVVGQQLRHSKDGQHNGDVRCALEVL